MLIIDKIQNSETLNENNINININKLAQIVL
jgi:hypothetical protein